MVLTDFFRFNKDLLRPAGDFWFPLLLSETIHPVDRNELCCPTGPSKLFGCYFSGIRLPSYSRKLTILGFYPAFYPCSL